MFLKSKRRPGAMTSIGLFCLAFGGIWHRVAVAHLHVPENLADGLFGFAYGLAIPLMLLGIRERVRLRRGRGDPPCGRTV